MIIQMKYLAQTVAKTYVQKQEKFAANTSKRRGSDQEQGNQDLYMLIHNCDVTGEKGSRRREISGNLRF